MEKEEMTRLFQAYADDMLRLAYSYLGSRADAEDVCQTVFLRMAEGRAKPREGKEKVFLLPARLSKSREACI